MPKQLMGAIVRKNRIDATFQYDAMGATKVARKESGWPADVIAKGAALIAACDAQTPDLDDVVEVQIYTAITDPEDHPPYSVAGDLIDVRFTPNSSPRETRVGDDEYIPTSVATARDELKAAIEAAL